MGLLPATLRATFHRFSCSFRTTDCPWERAVGGFKSGFRSVLRVSGSKGPDLEGPNGAKSDRPEGRPHLMSVPSLPPTSCLPYVRNFSHWTSMRAHTGFDGPHERSTTATFRLCSVTSQR